ncbi:hypothetical protein CYA_2819 [Synechococcus sp. JA-3-3Ab]|nr:hypothetical protein CYA_2819 [Synechococcus sp. JA-3-3Ab]
MIARAPLQGSLCYVGHSWAVPFAAYQTLDTTGWGRQHCFVPEIRLGQGRASGRNPQKLEINLDF